MSFFACGSSASDAGVIQCGAWPRLVLVLVLVLVTAKSEDEDENEDEPFLTV